ncbi:aldo/keto reductase [Protaetiibacter intestinalis]|uniref:Aldo/keto reductase n=1 Tax=Protaetiibacter intestinalis TaxID=2419774 RepID=A0A387BCI3_9MICO|nr:aldo/keto reductase [Protaetiibacter intestinalis]AYF98805.1 aldo/keto reductase [Protaetiibacter intestinalis]
MDSRILGPSSLSLSVVGLGCNNLGRAGTATLTQEGATAVVHAALDAGVTFFDTADIYGTEYGLSETLLGEALRGRRDEAVIATKFGHVDFPSPLSDVGPRGSRSYLRAAVEGSLRRLQTDRIDLYQQHTPDAATPVEETLAALDELVREGKVRAIGQSNFDGVQLRAADDAATALGIIRFASAQNEYSLLARGAELELLPAVRERGLGFLPFFPLANGLFTGKFSRTERPADTRISRQRPHIAENAPWDAIEAIEAFAAERGIGILEATFGWLLARPELTSVIAGATRPEQIRANADAGTAWRPTPEEHAYIDGLFPRAA